MTIWTLLATLLPIAVILALLLVWKKPADISGIFGWVAIAAVAMIVFNTSIEVIARSTLAGIIKSFPVSLIVAMSLLQMAYLEKTGALKRIIVFIKTIALANRAVQIMMINIGFGTLMVAVGATPVSLLPPILIAMGYTTYQAIALPAIGYDSLCTYALLGAPLVVFQDIANRVLKQSLSLSDIGMVFFMFLPLVSMLIGFCMLWIVGKWKAVKQGWLPCLITGIVIGIVSYFTNRYDNLVILTGVLCGIAVIAVMAIYLKVTGKKIIDKSVLTPEEREIEKNYPLWKAFTPWAILIVLVMAMNVPKDLFNWLYGTMTLPIMGLTADGSPINGRFLWQAYTWIFISIIVSLPFLRPTKTQLKETLKVWLKRAPRPVFAAAIFFAVGEILAMSGFDMGSKSFANPSMVKVLADYSSSFFQGAYGVIVGFIGLFAGFITGSEASSIAMFAKYSIATAQNLSMSLHATLIVAAGLAFGSGLASVISPAKLQNAAASIDKIGEERGVIRSAFIFALLLTIVTAIYVVILLAI